VNETYRPKNGITTATATKTSVKKCVLAALNFIALIPSRSIYQMLANFSGVEFLRTVLKFRKRQRRSLSCVNASTNREIRQFHVEVVQRRQRNVQKSVMHVQSN